MTEQTNNEHPCTGNCLFEHYMLLSICTTCGADDWGIYPEPEISLGANEFSRAGQKNLNRTLK